MPYTITKFPNFPKHDVGYENFLLNLSFWNPTEFDDCDEEDLYNSQLYIVNAYLKSRMATTSIGEKTILAALQNVIDKVEAVHARMERILRSGEVFGDARKLTKKERANLLNANFTQLNEVLANVRLIYIPQCYEKDSLELNARVIRLAQLSDADYSVPMTQKIDNLKLLVNQLPGADNKYYLQLGLALLALTLLCLSIAIILGNPSIVGLVAGNYLLPITLLSITSFWSNAVSLAFFAEGLMTPKLAQAVQKVALISNP